MQYQCVHEILYMLLQPHDDNDKPSTVGPIMTSLPLVNVSNNLLQYPKSSVIEIFWLTN